MYVQQRNEKLIVNAAKSSAVVSSLFPGTLRDRVINQSDQNNLRATSRNNGANLKSFLAKGGDMIESSEPLADFFVETTILFADLVGFTAWSSVREPTQVFTLLESVYSAFDKIAMRRGVYKIETVGDCYVAVTGLPEPRKDHAVAMARFARDIIYKMSELTKSLETSLGPGTADLTIRVGIHSGPVTAGVLRGERARFQLFGDTMNTCSRMESSGVAGRVHVSKETAQLLIRAGKESWIYPREEKVYAKGKGELETFFLHLGASHSSDQQSSNGGSDKLSSHFDDDDMGNTNINEVCDNNHVARLIDWNVEKLVIALRDVIARRRRNTAPLKPSRVSAEEAKVSKIPIEGVKDVIELPTIDLEPFQRQDVVLPNECVDQMRDFVTCIASMYRANPFHNFDHASHVVMSVTKLFSRIIAPTDIVLDKEGLALLDDRTFGIASDPLTWFACIFAALVHDVDHAGVPNSQLVKENQKLASLYSNRSVAEQNSFDLSWNLFIDERFGTFRNVLCPTLQDLIRFRQLVLNSVMATDIMDKDIVTARSARWSKAFKERSVPLQNGKIDTDRKATIVIEHIIQASDVAHTMQHWHVYRKWNEKLFVEMQQAFLEGRAARHPCEFWYEGELGFFDFYVIPLARKLYECGVFGKSSEEYLRYAEANRSEWERRGNDIVNDMLRSAEPRGEE